MHYLLFYEVENDYVSKRAKFRKEHLEKAWKAHARGELVLAGALANPVDAAVLLFEGDSPEVAERFAKADPYVTSGAVKRWYVREWTTVVGENAATPINSPACPSDEQASATVSNLTDTKNALQCPGRILRMWKGRSSVEKSREYARHAMKEVFPGLGSIEGHRGACLLRREVDGLIEFLVLTFWDSMEAVMKFADAEPQKAVVEPAARALLTQYDDTVAHFEIIPHPGENS